MLISIYKKNIQNIYDKINHYSSPDRRRSKRRISASMPSPQTNWQNKYTKQYKYFAFSGFIQILTCFQWTVMQYIPLPFLGFILKSSQCYVIKYLIICIPDLGRACPWMNDKATETTTRRLATRLPGDSATNSKIASKPKRDESSSKRPALLNHW